jgi:hypothetical protein
MTRFLLRVAVLIAGVTPALIVSAAAAEQPRTNR